MKLISAIIRPPKLEAVLAALADVSIERMTICDGQSYDNPLGDDERHTRIVNLEIVVNDDFLDRALERIQNAARTGSDGADGDGKVFVFPVEDAIRIDRSERGPQAV